MQRLLVATHNRHKIEEICFILGTRIDVLGADSFGCTLEPEETGTTFAENAQIKARAWRRWLIESPKQAPALDGVLADDSGLEVDALNGAPGVFSARFAAELGQRGNSTDFANNAKLLRVMSGIRDSERTARFRCVLALLPLGAEAEGSEGGWLFEGSCEGRIAREPSGVGGFGYDPLFIPHGFDRSLATLGPEVKNRLSHRSRALFGLRRFLNL